MIGERGWVFGGVKLGFLIWLVFLVEFSEVWILFLATKEAYYDFFLLEYLETNAELDYYFEDIEFWWYNGWVF